MTQVFPLINIYLYTVARAFVDQRLLKYEAPKTVLADNGSRSASELFWRVCIVMGSVTYFTSTYHPHTNDKSLTHSRTILAMLF